MQKTVSYMIEVTTIGHRNNYRLWNGKGYQYHIIEYPIELLGNCGNTPFRKFCCIVALAGKCSQIQNINHISIYVVCLDQIMFKHI